MHVIVNEGGTIQQGRKVFTPGDVVTVSKEEAARLIERGAATPGGTSRNDRETEPSSDLPKEIPARAALVEAGLTLDEIGARLKAGTIAEVDGIGEAKAAALQDWFSNQG